MSDLVGYPEDWFSQNEAQLRVVYRQLTRKLNRIATQDNMQGVQRRMVLVVIFFFRIFEIIIFCIVVDIIYVTKCTIWRLCHEKTCFLHMRKQRHRLAAR